MLKRSKEVKSYIFLYVNFDTNNEDFQNIYIDIMEHNDSFSAYMFKIGYEHKMLIYDVPKELDDGEIVTPDSFLKELNNTLKDDNNMQEFIKRYENIKNMMSEDLIIDFDLLDEFSGFDGIDFDIDDNDNKLIL